MHQDVLAPAEVVAEPEAHLDDGGYSSSVVNRS